MNNTESKDPTGSTNTRSNEVNASKATTKATIDAINARNIQNYQNSEHDADYETWFDCGYAAFRESVGANAPRRACTPTEERTYDAWADGPGWGMFLECEDPKALTAADFDL